MSVTIGTSLRPGKRSDGRDMLCIRISYGGDTRYRSTGFYVLRKHWNTNQERLRVSHPDQGLINERLTELETIARTAANEVIAEGRGTTADRIKERLNEKLEGASRGDFLDFADELVEGYRSRDQIGTAKTYRAVLNKFEDYVGKDSLAFTELTPKLIRGFRNYMHDLGNAQNTVAKGLKTIRIFVNKARDEGHMERDPFSSITIRREKTEKEVLRIEQIRKIEALDLNPDHLIWDARNWFLFSFYAGGMRFSDLALLRNENLRKQGGQWTLRYAMAKTGDPDVMPLVDPAIEIVQRYYDPSESGQGLLFSVLEGYDLSTPEKRRSAIESRNAAVNKKLRTIRKWTGLDVHFSFHTARRSIAFHMRRQGKSSAVIKEILGHSSLQVTENYLSSLPEDHKRDEMESLF